MTGNWTLNSIELTATNITVVVTEKQESRGVRVAETSLEAGGEDIQHLGRDKGRSTVTFTILGRGLALHDMATQIRGILEDGTTWTLKAPEGDDVEAYASLRSGRFRTIGEVQAQQRNRVRVDVTVPSAFLGDPAQVPEEEALVVDYLTNDHYAATNTSGNDAVTRHWLPPQATGYPRARDLSTGIYETLTGSWTYTASLPDGTTEVVTSYALTNYVHGFPLSSGDGGPSNVQRRDS